jgi:hypothetical protein
MLTKQFTTVLSCERSLTWYSLKAAISGDQRLIHPSNLPGKLYTLIIQDARRISAESCSNRLNFPGVQKRGLLGPRRYITPNYIWNEE